MVSVSATTERPPVIQMRGISKRFPGVQALDNVDFELRVGEVHALVGENGAGKSTLIKVIAGLYPKDGGEILLAGQPFDIHGPLDSLRQGIKVVFQELDLVPTLSVAENVFLEGFPRASFGRVNWSKMWDETRRLLERVGLDVDPKTKVARLSVAQQQLVEIARALSHSACLLCMDEPTSALAPAEIERLFAVIRSVKEDGVGVIYVSHKLDEIMELADRVTVFRDGRHVWTKPIAEVNCDSMITAMVGREVTQLFPKTERKPGKAMLEVQGLTSKRVRNVSLEVRSGEVVGVFGLMGAGRTELARAIFGIDPSDAGRISLDGQEMQRGSAHDACKRGMGLLTENRKEDGLVLPMSVQHNITLAALHDFARSGWIESWSEKDKAAEFVEKLEIKTPSLTQKVMFLSGGNQQKVLIARWLLKKLKLLILDEPTRGIDVGAKSEIHKLVDELANQGLGVLVMSSEMPELLGISDRILVMRDGEIVGDLTREEATQEMMMACIVGERKSAATGN